jgi:hypothetical protein
VTLTEPQPSPAPHKRRAPTVRHCSAPGCDRPARKRGRTCGRCATRAWRKRHRTTIAARERTRTFSADQHAARTASAILFTYLRRGELHRNPCQTCGRNEVVPHWPDLAQPLEVVWFCRAHRTVERERLAAERERLAEETAATTKVVAWKTLGERFEAEWPQLAPDLQARLRAEVERSSAFRIVRANPQSPLYRQQLVAAFGRYCATQEPAPSG